MRFLVTAGSTRERIECGCPHRLARAQAEAGMVPGAADGVADHQALSERPVIVGAGRADGERDGRDPGPRLVALRQDAGVLMIGERTNANGSKKFRDTMLEGDWDSCVRIARDQEREGAHVLDVCVDYVGRDGTVDMDEIVSRFATQVTVPLVLDSTEPPVIEAGLQRLGGKAILNSANLEDGEGPGSRFDRVMSLAREYGRGPDEWEVQMLLGVRREAGSPAATPETALSASTRARAFPSRPRTGRSR